MRLALVIFSLGPGGAERVMSLLAQEWVTRGKDVTLITLESKGTDFHSVPDRVSRVALGISGSSRNAWTALSNNRQRIRALRRSICAARPDAIVSFVDSTNLLVLMATLGLGTPVIVAERTHPGKHDIGLVRSVLRYLLYPLARAVVVQTEGTRSWMATRIRGTELYVIPNFALPCQTTPPPDLSMPRTRRVVVAVGRLSPEKGFDYLLDAFARCSQGQPSWLLQLVGEGPERAALGARAASLGIADRVQFLGLVRNLGAVFQHSDIFVLPSRFEGFPNALLEAMACGLPAVAFDCPSGPRDVIRHGVDGLLVPPENVKALAEALDRLMSDDAERKRLGSCAPAVVDRFSVKRVMQMWDGVLTAATAV